MQLPAALAVGMTAGTVAYFAGPWLAAGVSATGGFAMTLAVLAGVWLRRTLGISAVPNAGPKRPVRSWSTFPDVTRLTGGERRGRLTRVWWYLGNW